MVRRDFLKASAIGAAGIMMPAGIVSASAASKASAKKSANGKINMGFIGLGQQAMYLLQGFMKMDDVRVVAGCDVYDIKRDRFVKRVTKYYQEKGEKKVKVDMYEDYQDLLARPDIDAVVDSLDGFETVIFAGGITPRLEGEQMDDVDIPGFLGGDRTSIELPAIQKQLVKALVDAGKKVIFVNFSGSTIALKDEDKLCSAILQAWYPGQEGGYAVADVLYGDFNPSGRLPLTFYADDSQVKDFNDYDMEGRTYRYFRGTPLYPFGYGLSYTNFKYGRPKFKTMADGSKAVVVRVKNKGRKDGDEIVQLYISRPDDAQGPVKALRGMKRVSLKARKAAKVVIPIEEDTFNWWDAEAGRVVPRSGEYVLYVGGSSADSAQKTIKVTI